MFNLYILDTCPYCKKVLKFADKNNIEYKIHNIISEVEKTELVKLGGKEQVPYLYNSETKYGLYESDDIIEYLKTIKG